MTTLFIDGWPFYFAAPGGAATSVGATDTPGGADLGDAPPGPRRPMGG